MQKHPDTDMALVDQEDDFDSTDDDELAEIIHTAPRRKRLNVLLFVALILVLVIFTYLGVTTIQHIPPSTSGDDLGAIYNVISVAGII